MAIIAAIAAVSRNGVIGLNNKLPWHISGDLKYFKQVTLGKPYIMGRKSYESLGKPLPGRLNIIITRNPEAIKAATLPPNTGLLTAISVEDALDKARVTNAEEIMIGGGAQIYAAFMPYTQRLYITRVERDYNGDTFFPTIDDAEWRVVSDIGQDGDPPYRFTVLERVEKRPS